MPKRHGVACKTCRRRGRKCTRELPFCQSCIDKGIECEGYPLKWAGLASRGYLSGQAGIGQVDFSKGSTSRRTKKRQEPGGAEPSQALQATPKTPIDTSAPPIQVDALATEETALLDIFPDDWSIPDLVAFEPENQVTGSELVQTTVPSSGSFFALDITQSPIDFGDMQNAIIPPPLALNAFQIPAELTFVLEYHFYEAASKLCVDNNTTRNPYREYIYPLALQKPALLYACAALSSVHYSTRHQNESFAVEALRFRGKALSRLQESMWSIDSSLDEGNLATLLMLILCDMCMGGHSNFGTYFTMAKTLISLRGHLKTPGNFVEEYISWMDIMSCASTSRQPVFTIEDVTSLQEGRADWNHDVVPCAAGLFRIFLDIVSLYKCKPVDTVELDAQLETLKTKVLTCPPRIERGMPWFHLTEAYRFAVLLYTNLLFEKDGDEDEITWLVSSIVQHTKSIPSNSGWSDQLLWPLFHAGLRMSDPRQQTWLREKLSSMQSSGGFRNVNSAQEVLDMCWSGQFSGSYAELLVKDGVGDMLVI